jgi:predicted protein tyrosine phosphatase
MKTFVWCPRETAKLCHHRFTEPHVHIGIRNVDAEITKPGCSGGALFLEFHDLGDNAPAELHDGLFKPSQAKQIAEFVHKHDGLIVVNCEAGLSRSPGVVLALRRFFGGDTEEVFQKAMPNIFVTSLLTRALRGIE